MVAALLFYNKANMKKTIIIFLLTLLPFAAFSQASDNLLQIKFGYLSYSEALKSMSDYAVMQKNVASLRAQYEEETKRAQQEFNQKYESFLEGQRDFAPAILDKRQSELQELLNKNIAFKEEAARLLKQAEADMTAPIKKKLNNILSKIARDRGYILILNTDGDTLPFIDSAYGEDINTFVKNVLKEM